jgi:hypothetical protein
MPLNRRPETAPTRLIDGGRESASRSPKRGLETALTAFAPHCDPHVLSRPVCPIMPNSDN